MKMSKLLENSHFNFTADVIAAIIVAVIVFAFVFMIILSGYCADIRVNDIQNSDDYGVVKNNVVYRVTEEKEKSKLDLYIPVKNETDNPLSFEEMSFSLVDKNKNVIYEDAVLCGTPYIVQAGETTYYCVSKYVDVSKDMMDTAIACNLNSVAVSQSDKTAITGISITNDSISQNSKGKSYLVYNRLNYNGVSYDDAITCYSFYDKHGNFLFGCSVEGPVKSPADKPVSVSLEVDDIYANEIDAWTIQFYEK